MFCKNFTWMIRGLSAVFLTKKKASIYLQEYRKAVLSAPDFDLVHTVDVAGEHATVSKDFPVDPVFGVDDVRRYYGRKPLGMNIH